MKHCHEFNALDIWYLKDTEEMTNRILYIGVCPRCEKYVSELIEKNKKTNTYSIKRKTNEKAKEEVIKLLKERIYSRNEINKMKFKNTLYGWRYGLNKEITKKDGSKTIKQYAKDFFNGIELVKKI